MDKNEMNNKDYEFLMELIEISSKLNSYLGSMYDLEINEKKESIEYKNFYSDYAKLLEEERKKYELIDNIKCIKFIEYMGKNMLPKRYNNTINCIINQQYQNIIIRRVLSKLILKIANNVEINSDNQLNEFTKKIVILKVKQNNEIEKAITSDLLINFLILIESEIKNPASKKIINKLKKLKYDIFFISESVEKEILRTNFNLPSDLYIQSQLLADLSNFDGDMLKQFLKRQLFLSFEQSDSLLKEIKMKYCLDFAINRTVELLNYTDSDYSDTDKLFLSIIRQTFLKSVLLILNQDSINKIIDSFNKIVQSQNYLDRHGNDTISKIIITDILSNSEKRKDVKVLSLIRS